MSNKKDKEAYLKRTLVNTLKYGVLSALLFAIIGIILLFFKTSGENINEQYKTFTKADFNLKNIFTGLFELNPNSFLYLGIMILLLTPILRVVFAIKGFQLQGDNLYVRIGTVVLLIILGSIIYGSISS